jgi:hypothetical protein
MASTCHEWTGRRSLHSRQSQTLLIVLAKHGCYRTPPPGLANDNPASAGQAAAA